MLKIENPIQNYDWGCCKSFKEFFGIDNPENLPMAEMWMGSHPNGCSKVFLQGEWYSLSSIINNSPTEMLGDIISKKYSSLPFLFKVLAADKPLSIQVHPNLDSAKLGFENENRLGIPFSSFNRNYKDDNHKPELIYALTNFTAMNGFRCFDEIVSLLKILQSKIISADEFIREPSEQKLKILFRNILELSDKEKTEELNNLLLVAKRNDSQPWSTVVDISNHWPDDVGLFMPLLLNVISLKPGEAMFLDACTPHAYMSGLGLEIMANSDNVLRAGLTNKYIDIQELIENVDFISRPFQSLIFNPEINGNIKRFNVPVEDFSFSIIDLKNKSHFYDNHLPIIAFCLEGNIFLNSTTGSLQLSKGESAFIPANNLEFISEGIGTLVIASCGNNDFKVK